MSRPQQIVNLARRVAHLCWPAPYCTVYPYARQCIGCRHLIATNPGSVGRGIWYNHFCANHPKPESERLAFDERLIAHLQEHGFGNTHILFCPAGPAPGHSPQDRGMRNYHFCRDCATASGSCGFAPKWWLRALARVPFVIKQEREE